MCLAFTSCTDTLSLMACRPGEEHTGTLSQMHSTHVVQSEAQAQTRQPGSKQPVKNVL